MAYERATLMDSWVDDREYFGSGVLFDRYTEFVDNFVGNPACTGRRTASGLRYDKNDEILSRNNFP